jgi:hypothetical protein
LALELRQFQLPRYTAGVAQDIGSMVPSYDVVYVLEERFG